MSTDVRDASSLMALSLYINNFISFIISKKITVRVVIQLHCKVKKKKLIEHFLNSIWIKVSVTTGLHMLLIRNLCEVLWFMSTKLLEIM